MAAPGNRAAAIVRVQRASYADPSAFDVADGDGGFAVRGRFGTGNGAAKTFYDGTGSDAWTSTSDELAKFQSGEALKWGKVIKAAGIEPV
jgi:hypothetical protein